MKKIDKAVEIIRGWSDEELKAFIICPGCPNDFNIEDCKKCHGYASGDCERGWNEEVEE